MKLSICLCAFDKIFFLYQFDSLFPHFNCIYIFLLKILSIWFGGILIVFCNINLTLALIMSTHNNWLYFWTKKNPMWFWNELWFHWYGRTNIPKKKMQSIKLNKQIYFCQNRQLKVAIVSMNQNPSQQYFNWFGWFGKQITYLWIIIIRFDALTFFFVSLQINYSNRLVKPN